VKSVVKNSVVLCVFVALWFNHSIDCNSISAKSSAFDFFFGVVGGGEFACGAWQRYGIIRVVMMKCPGVVPA